MQFVEDLEKEEGYSTFVFKEDSVWKQMPRKKVMTRVTKSLTDHKKNKSEEKGFIRSQKKKSKEKGC